MLLKKTSGAALIRQIYFYFCRSSSLWAIVSKLI